MTAPLIAPVIPPPARPGVRGHGRAKPYIVIPAVLRRRCGLRPGDQVLLAMFPGDNALAATCRCSRELAAGQNPRAVAVVASSTASRRAECSGPICRRARRAKDGRQQAGRWRSSARNAKVSASKYVTGLPAEPPSISRTNRRHPHQRLLHLRWAGSPRPGTDLRVVITASELPQELYVFTEVLLDPAGDDKHGYV